MKSVSSMIIVFSFSLQVTLQEQQDLCGNNSIYKRFSVNHSACKSSDDSSTCKKTNTGVNEEDIQTILGLHNRLRERIASGSESKEFKFPSASDMLMMEWDNELAEVAQSHSNQCLFEHDCNDCRRVDDFAVGQNLYQRRTSWRHPIRNWTKAIQSFYDEISFAPTSIISHFKGGAYGHFSQVVWSETWKVGCGYSAHDIVDDAMTTFKTEELYVCNYGPAGNIRGSRMYRKGKPANKCPGNTAADPEFKSLCRVKTKGGPVYSSPKNTSLLFSCSFSTAFNSTPCSLKINDSSVVVVETPITHYLSLSVNSGSSVKIELPGSFSHKKGFCLTMIQRKGSNDVRIPSLNDLSVQLMVPDIDWSTSMSFGRDSLDWITSSININWSYSTKIVITFSVPVNATGSQFYEIQSMIVKKGRC